MSIKKTENLKILHHILAPQHDPFTFDDSLKMFRLFKDRYSKLRPHILLGIREYKFGYDKLLTRYPEYDCFDYSYVYFDNSPELWDDNFMDDSVWDLRQRPFAPRTVIYTAIQLAVFLKYRRIFLFGVDHNYILDVSKTTDLHFYPDAVELMIESILKNILTKKHVF
jgi:hypothetical protein